MPGRLLGLAVGRRGGFAAACGLVLSVAGLTVYVLIGSPVNHYSLAGSVHAGGPRGWRTVSYRGVSVAVPATWPVVDLRARPAACPRLDVHAVYLGTPGPHPRCPASGLGAKTESVQIGPAIAGSPAVLTATRPVTIGTAAAKTNPQPGRSHTITDVFPAAGMEVDLSYGTHAAFIKRVQATMRVRAGPSRPHALLTAPLSSLPQGKVQGKVSGLGFDACSAPSAGVMRAWLSSHYRSVGVYIGGADRACSQPYLTAGWINQVESMGWHVFPLYVGPQAPCVNAPGNLTFAASQAATVGTASAADAAVQASSLRFPHGTPVIYDMEAYSGCGHAVVKFLNAWDKKLHAKGYGAGVYESFSNVSDLVSARGSVTEPDIMFYADWDGQATTNSSYMPSTMWTHYQRIHQYVGNSTQTWGGITLNIDQDKLSANLGGSSPPPLQNRPQTAVVDTQGTVRVYSRGGGGPLWEDHYTSGTPWAWQNLNGVWRSDPAAVVGTNGTVRVYAVGVTNGQLYQNELPRGGAWSGWWSMGGKWPWSAAAVVTPSGMIKVFAVGTTGLLYVRVRQPSGGWSGWNIVGGASLSGTPTAIVDHAGWIRVYVRGGSRTLREASLAPGGSWAWGNMHGTWNADAAAVVGADGTVRVYATGTNGRLFEDYLPVGGSWSGWQSRRCTTCTGAPAAVVDHAGAVRVFVRAGGGALQEAALTPGSPWAWDNLAGTWRTDPSAVVAADGTVRVYATGVTNNDVYERHLPPGGAWSGWWRMGSH